MVFLDQCNENIKDEAEKFVEQIKTGKIRKREIYNGESSQERYLENCLESFKSLTKSEKIMNDYYK